MNNKQLGKKVDAKVAEARDRATGAIESYIEAGLLLIKAKNDTDDFNEWLKSNCHVKAVQANKIIRVASHQHQARRLEKSSDNPISIDGLQKILPKVSEPPEAAPADAKKMGYTGKQPGTTAESDHWHTPKELTDAACKVMGSIDLDPFSSTEANTLINAKHILTLADNALITEWAKPDIRTCWMNPPYSKGASSKAVDKFLEQFDHGAFDQAIVLMNSSTDTNWFHRLANVANAVCFTKGRISFIGSGGKKSSGNTKGQVFFYFGSRAKTFEKTFKEHGLVLMTGTV